jgi:UDP-2,4-diacetamido-2,4,6-trideoxy-beta-L-altropyranose hydrolase
MSGKLIFRVNGNNEIGLGHLYRCLALAELVKSKFECIFVTEAIPESLVLQITVSYRYFKVHEENDFLLYDDLFEKGDVIILDGYKFDYYYQKRLRSFEVKLVVIDDFVALNYSADVIINHGISNSCGYNSVINGLCKVYTGFEHVIVRKAFLEQTFIHKTIESINTLFICMGGADPFQLTQKALNSALKSCQFKRIIVVTGAAFNFNSTFRDLINKSCLEIEVSHYHNISDSIMAKLMGKAQIAICPSSTISLEACCVRMGLLTGYGIDNQRAIHNQLIERECAISVGDLNDITEDKLIHAIKKMSRVDVVRKLISNQKEIFDGLSSKRNLEIFSELAI